MNIMHTSQNERTNMGVGDTQSEIHFYTIRIAGVLTGRNAHFADGVKRGLASTSGSDTDEW